MNRIALVGGSYSGKTTVAQELEKRGYTLINFTDSLKVLAVEALASIRVVTSVQEIKNNKQKYRPFLQELGTLIGYDDNPIYVDRAVWVSHLEPVAHVVFDNVRTIKQWDALNDYEFKLVYIKVSERVRRARAYELGVTPGEFTSAMKNPVEDMVWAEDCADLTVDGTQPIEKIIENIVGRGATVLA